MTYHYNNEMFKYDDCFLLFDIHDEEDKKFLDVFKKLFGLPEGTETIKVKGIDMDFYVPEKDDARRIPHLIRTSTNNDRTRGIETFAIMPCYTYDDLTDNEKDLLNNGYTPVYKE